MGNKNGLVVKIYLLYKRALATCREIFFYLYDTEETGIVKEDP